MIDIVEHNDLKAKIRVFGVGGAGGNALNNMVEEGLEGVEFIAANTDVQVLNGSLATKKITLGQRLTGGLGAGGNPEVGMNAAIEDRALVSEEVAGADMVFITAGMGGGTGTGAAPVIAELAREAGALTVGVVTKPFRFEGRVRARNAERGLEALAQAVDSLIIIPNDRLLEACEERVTVLDAFRMADRVLFDAVRSIAELIVTRGLINVDFADVRTIMRRRGRALMGTGYGTGEDRAVQAATMAMSSPLLEDNSIEGATGILVNVTGPPDLTLQEVVRAASLVEERAHESAEVIYGMVVDESMKDRVRLTVVATGFQSPAELEETNRNEAPLRQRRADEPALGDMAGTHHSTGLAGGFGGYAARPPALPMAAPAMAAAAAPAGHAHAHAHAAAGAAVPPALPLNVSPVPPEAGAQLPGVGAPNATDPSKARREPRIFNPWADPARSEWDSPTFMRQQQRGIPRRRLPGMPPDPTLPGNE